MYTNKQIILVGDTHGVWNQLFHKLHTYDIHDTILIHVGDVGIGFTDAETQHKILVHVSNILGERNSVMYAIRGNHDDPSYFTGLNNNYANIILLPDYSYLDLNGETWLFVGGAVSIDRHSKDFRNNDIRVQGKTWWHDEAFVYKPDLVKKSCDVLVTHSAPMWIGPSDKEGLKYYTQNDPTLWDDCVQERNDIDALIQVCRAKKHYCGHFHVSAIGENYGCRTTILNINELLEHR